MFEAVVIIAALSIFCALLGLMQLISDELESNERENNVEKSDRD